MTPSPTQTAPPAPAPPLVPPEPPSEREPSRLQLGLARWENGNGSLALLGGFVAAFVVLGVVRSWWIPGVIAGLLFILTMHELGHYLTARATGMKVERFFLGLGPKIWSFERGETEYGVRALPVLAYVRIVGMTNVDQVAPADASRAYRAQPYWQRMIVICAGSAMHFLMAIGALVVLFGAYGYAGIDGPAWQVGRVVEGSTAEHLGVESGDQITRFDGQAFDTWNEFGDIVLATPVGPIQVEVERDGERIMLDGALGARSGDVVGAGFGAAISEVDASQGWRIEALRAGSSAETLGLRVNDLIVDAHGIERPAQRQLAELLEQREGETITIQVERRQKLVEVEGVVELDRSQPFRGFLGVGPAEVDEPDATWAESPGRAIQDFVSISKTNIAGLVSLLNPFSYIGGSADADRVTTPGPSAPGPEVTEPGNRPVSVIGIARLFAQSQSVDQVLYLFALVNIFVGLFNLVPLLPFDGGHAALGTYERARQLITRNLDYRVDAYKLMPLTSFVVIGLVGLGVWAAVLDIFAWPA